MLTRRKSLELPAFVMILKKKTPHDISLRIKRYH